MSHVSEPNYDTSLHLQNPLRLTIPDARRILRRECDSLSKAGGLVARGRDAIETLRISYSTGKIAATVAPGQASFLGLECNAAAVGKSCTVYRRLCAFF